MRHRQMKSEKKKLDTMTWYISTCDVEPFPNRHYKLRHSDIGYGKILKSISDIEVPHQGPQDSPFFQCRWGMEGWK